MQKSINSLLIGYYEIDQLRPKHMLVIDWIDKNYDIKNHSEIFNKIIENYKFFPTVAEIRNLLHISIEDKANLSANMLANAIINYTNEIGCKKKARKTMGELAWQICESLGGIYFLYSQLENGLLNINYSIPQWKALAKSILSHEEKGHKLIGFTNRKELGS